MSCWSPWHGCHKISTGCRNCYVYRRDASVGRDASQVFRTKDFDLPLRKNARGEYKLCPGEEIFTCGTSDFFLDEADEWRREAWAMIRQRSDLRFLIITKRIHRFYVSLPEDWGEGYENVAIGCTCECEQTAQDRLPLFLQAPIVHRFIMCEPLLSAIDLRQYLGKIEKVAVGGESGKYARICDYEWVLDIRDQCVCADVPFLFRQTGTHLKKDGRVYEIPRSEHARQAQKARINYR